MQNNNLGYGTKITHGRIAVNFAEAQSEVINLNQTFAGATAIVRFLNANDVPCNPVVIENTLTVYANLTGIYTIDYIIVGV